MMAIPITDIEPREWDELVASSPQAWLFHRRSWIALETRFGGAVDLSFGIRVGKNLAAAVPLYCSRLGLGLFVETLLHGGLHRHTGLAFDPRLNPSDVAAVRTVAMNAILKTACDHDVDRIYFAHQNLSPESLSPHRREIPFWVLDYGFALGNSFGPGGVVPGPGLATTVVDQIVDLTRSEDELFAALDESCRRAVRKGLNAGLDAVELGADPHCIEAYWRLANLSAARTGEQLPDVAYYEAIRSEFAPHGEFDAVFVKSGETFVAAAILLRFKRACHFLAGVSDPSYLGHRVNDVLHWSAILHAKRRGDLAYRLGPFFPTSPRGWPIETVTRFKSKFGAQAWTIVQGSRFLRPERYGELAKAHVDLLCSEQVR